MSTKPIAYVNREYMFTCGEGPVPCVNGVLENVDQSTFIVADEGYWDRIEIDGERYTVDQVTVEATGSWPLRHRNEDSESIRSAETIQSLRAENAKLLQRIQDLKTALIIYETAIVFTGSLNSLAMARDQIAYTLKHRTGGAK